VGSRGNVAAHQLAVALTWVHRGQPVIPCSRRDKAALENGFKAAASPAELRRFYDPEQVRQWWTGEYERAHVGLLTRHLVVLDLDQPKAGAERLDGRWDGCQDGADVLALRLGGEWPETYTVLTPSGGLHLVYLQPTDEPIGCRTGTGRKDRAAPPAPGHIGPLVDVRGVGGYVIAAGSRSTAQGRPYERISPAAVGPQPLPESIRALLRRPAPAPAAPAAAHPSPIRVQGRADRYAQAALAGAANDVRAAPPREGNAMLFARARRLGELAATAPTIITLTAVEEHLVPAATKRGGDWTDHEARATILSGWTAGQRGAAA
jgi:hypothetical protein